MSAIERWRDALCSFPLMVQGGTTADSAPPRPRVRVLYIAGAPHSGSTILANSLCEVDGVFPTGELWLLCRQLATGQLVCGCRAKLDECDIWKPIAAEISSSLKPLDGDAINRALLANTRIRHFPRLLLSRWLGRPTPFRTLDGGRYSLGSLYRAVQQRTGAAVVIDTSKVPAFACFLEEEPDVELYVLHFIRDPRGAVKSWADWWMRTTGMGVHRAAVYTSLLWLATHAFTELAWSRRSRYLMARYEDFASDPTALLERILNFLAMEATPPMDPVNRGVYLHTNHTVYG